MSMSINRKSKTVADILERAATDAAFRTLLLTNPAAAMAGYSLSDEERAALSDRETVIELLR